MQAKMSKTFTYFAYGSNLCTKRIHVSNPSAVRIGIGKLNNYRLDFNRYSKRWHGCSATIAPQTGCSVWGALWEIDMKDLTHLDVQEGVHQNIYRRFSVEVELPDGGSKECYVYEQVDKPTMQYNLNELPDNRQPSQVYKNTITKGALESKLPIKYQEMLNSISCNTFNADVDLNTVE